MLCKPQLYAGAIRHTFATPIALSRLGDDLAHDSMPLSTLKQTKTARGLIRKDQQQHGLSSGSDSDARWGTRPSGRRNLKAQLASGAVLFRFCLSGLGTPGGATLRPPGVQRCGPATLRPSRGCNVAALCSGSARAPLASSSAPSFFPLVSLESREKKSGCRSCDSDLVLA